MTRQAFLNTLRQGLRGLPPLTVEEIAADYDAHFTDGLSAGRSEAEVAAALGDPGRLARELKAEAGLRRWEEERNPAAAAAAVLAVLGLATVDILLLAPILIAVGATIFALSVTALALAISGVGLIASPIAHPLFDWPIDAATTVFVGLGLISLGVGLAALLVPVVVGLLNLLGRYGRLHYRLLRPALSPVEARS